VVLLTAAPAPTWSAASDPITASVAGAVMQDSPKASSTMATMIGPKKAASGLDVSPAMTRPPAIRTSPVPTTSRVPTLRAATAARG
jgi:hypothetical protein